MEVRFVGLRPFAPCMTTDPRELPPDGEIDRLQLDLQATLLGTDPRSIGRFTDLIRLGEGGMGIVYRGRDPRLDREVAIKQTRIRTGSRGQARLEREAQLLGRLSHPNVLAVHELGEDGGNLFVVTELVDGRSLAQWCAETKERSSATVAEAVDFGTQAAKGIAAAHREGLLHRDVKPSNLLIDADGRLRVSDFGLAILGAALEDPEGLHTTRESANERLTGTGGHVGTPAYMAPEQHHGRATEASDQFSWAMSVYEAVYGERPFGPKALQEATGPAKPDRPHMMLDRSRQRVLERALQWDPEQRYPSMDAVVSAWEAGGGQNRTALIAVGALSLSLLGASAVAAPEADPKRCAGSERALEGVWTPERRAELVAHFSEVDPVLGERLASRTTSTLDAWVESYRVAHRAACEAGDLPGAAARQRCLNRRARAFEAAHDVLRTTDADGARRADRIVDGLLPADACSDPTFVAAMVEPPGNPDDAERVADVRAQLDRSEALLKAGEYDLARQAADDAVEASDAIDYAPLQAETRLQLGRVHSRSDSSEARTLAQESFVRAQAARDPLTAYRAARDLAAVHIRLDTKSDAEDALWLLDVADALAPQLGRAGAELRAVGILSLRGEALMLVGEESKSLALLEDAVARRSAAEAESPSLARAYVSLGTSRAKGGDLRGGRASFETARDIYERTLGPNHPETSNVYGNLGNIAAQLRELDVAEANYRRALEILERVFEPNNGRIADSLLGLASVQRQKDGPEVALATVERVLPIYLELYGPEDPRVASVHMTKGATLGSVGEYKASLESFQLALDIFRKTQTKDSRSVVSALANVARIQEAMGDDDGTMQSLTEAIALQDASGRGLTGNTLRLQLALARAELRADKRDQAIERLEAILKSDETAEIPALTTAQVQWLLGRSLAERGEVERGRELVATALAAYEAHGDTKGAAAPKAWLLGLGKVRE